MVFKKRESQRSRAAVAVQVLVALPLIFGLAAITVDVGVMYNTRSDMQRAADAAALAAVGVIAEAPDGTNPIPAAAATAADFVTRNAVVGRVLEVDPQTDVQAGRAVYDPIANTYNFTAGQQPLNAVRVTIRHTSSSANGALPLYFASLFGKSATNVTARATAMFADTSYVAADCVDSAQPGLSLMCIYGDSDDSDDSEAGTSDDSDDSDSGHADSGDSDSGDSDSGDSDSNDSDGDSDDSDDSVAGSSDDSDDSDSGDSDGST
ncbi:MAG: TadG family pilus assembly protein, partial [Phycisphaerae bacterium]